MSVGKMKLTCHVEKNCMDFESCRFDFRIDSKNGLTPTRRKRTERKNVNNFTLFKCKVCGLLFDGRPALLEHKLSHNKYKCNVCDARFARRYFLMDHAARTHGVDIANSHVKSRKRKQSTVLRMLAPKPSGAGAGAVAADDDFQLGSSAVMSSDSESPSPQTSPTTSTSTTRTGVSPGSAAACPVLPDLLQLNTSLPFPLPSPQVLPISPQTMGLPPSQLLSAAMAAQQTPLTSTSSTTSSLPPVLPTFSQGQTLPHGSATLPQGMANLPQGMANLPQGQPHLLSPSSTPDVPCVYINVPIFLSSGSSGTTTAPPLLATQAPSFPTPPVTLTTDTKHLDPSRLLPVNPFIRRDTGSANTARTVQTLNINDCIKAEQGDIRFENNNNYFIQQDLASPVSGCFTPKTNMDISGLSFHHAALLPNISPILPVLNPTPVSANDDQMEALDFSVKSKPASVSTSGSSDMQSGQVIDLRHYDPDTAVDLSCRPSTSEGQGTPQDDRVVMYQQYNIKHDIKPLLKHTDNNTDLEELTPKGSPKQNCKKSSNVLDKMVQRLWKNKMTKPRRKNNVDEETGDSPMDIDDVKFVKQELGHLPDNSSLGRVYVLNEVPEQINTYPRGMLPYRDAMDLSGKPQLGTEYGQVLSDGVLQSTAASIARAVISKPMEATTSQPDEKGFCAIKFHTCRVCKQLFYSAEEMWEHAVTHEDFHKYKCGQCPYVTACHRELVNHRQATHGHDMQKDGRHICNYPGCLRSYSEWRHLKQHQKCHQHQQDLSPRPIIKSETPTTPQQPCPSPQKGGRLICDYAGCFKTFKEWRHLKVHQTLHTGEKPLSCQLCNYACRHRSSMNWHMKSKHGLDKMKTQGNRTVYVDPNKRVVCGWSDEANREVNYLKEAGRQPLDMDIKPDPDDNRTASEYSSMLDEQQLSSADNSHLDSPHHDSRMSSVLQLDGSTSMSVTSSRPPSCAPSENMSERSLMDDPHMLMLKMQSKPGEFPLNMSVQIEDLSPKEQIVGEDGIISSKLSDDSDRMSDRCMSRESDFNLQSPGYPSSTMSSSVSSSEASSLATTEGHRLVMTPVASANLGQGSDQQASMMKFKLKYLVAPKYFPCKVCGDNFDNASKMWEHRIEKHQESTRFYCDNCGYDTESMEALQSHMMSTHGKEMCGMKDHVCFICGKGYATRTGLNQHLLRHSEEGPPEYECPYENCTSKVHSKCALKNHIRRVHLKVPAKYECPEEDCHRRFDSSSALKSHQVLHTDERPLTCDYPGCDKSFRETKHLKVHMMQHTDEKPLRCDECDYSCRQRNSMNWHMKSKHNREKAVTPDGRTIYTPILNTQ